MRSPAVLTTVLCALFVAGALIVAALNRDDFAFTLGVTPAMPVVTLDPGQQACQTGIVVPPAAGFDRVRFALGTFHRPGPAVSIVVRDPATRRVLGGGTLPGGYGDVAQAPTHTVAVGKVLPGSRVDVCLRNEGPRRVAVYGNADAASRVTTATVADAPAGVDLSLVFAGPQRSLLARLPAIAERAALFRADPIGPWTFWVVAALALLGVPALLATAVSRASRAPGR
jgi:hypothetical protein